MITHHFDGESNQACLFPSVQLLHASIVDSRQIQRTSRCNVHSHIFTELVYVLQGNGWIEVDGQRVDLHTGTILVLNPQLPHQALRTDTEDFSVLILGMCCSCATIWKADSYCLICGSDAEELAACLQLFFRELKEQRDQFEFACQQLAQLIPLHLGRLYPDARVVSSSRKSTLDCSRVRQYIDEHFAESITLDKLAKYAGLNKYYLVHVFNREMGCSPISYLIERRISESKRLLSATSISVQQISAQLGFSSPSYFSQSFRRSTGFSPVEFRRQILAANGSEPTE